MTPDGRWTLIHGISSHGLLPGELKIRWVGFPFLVQQTEMSQETGRVRFFDLTLPVSNSARHLAPHFLQQNITPQVTSWSISF